MTRRYFGTSCSIYTKFIERKNMLKSNAELEGSAMTRQDSIQGSQTELTEQSNYLRRIKTTMDCARFGKATKEQINNISIS